jgi:hypothetical protein
MTSLVARVETFAQGHVLVGGSFNQALMLQYSCPTVIPQASVHAKIGALIEIRLSHDEGSREFKSSPLPGARESGTKTGLAAALSD